MNMHGRVSSEQLAHVQTQWSDGRCEHCNHWQLRVNCIMLQLAQCTYKDAIEGLRVTPHVAKSRKLTIVEGKAM